MQRRWKRGQGVPRDACCLCAALQGPADGWIKAQIHAGHYTNDSEYIRDLIRREQERIAQVEALRAALIEGENSGPPQKFDAQAFKARLMTGVHG